MAIPFLIGLAVGSATVLTWNRFKGKNSALPKNGENEDNSDNETPLSEEDGTDKTTDTQTKPSANKKKA